LSKEDLREALAAATATQPSVRVLDPVLLSTVQFAFVASYLQP